MRWHVSLGLARPALKTFESCFPWAQKWLHASIALVLHLQTRVNTFSKMVIQSSNSHTHNIDLQGYIEDPLLSWVRHAAQVLSAPLHEQTERKVLNYPGLIFWVQWYTYRVARSSSKLRYCSSNPHGTCSGTLKARSDALDGLYGADRHRVVEAVLNNSLKT